MKAYNPAFDKPTNFHEALLWLETQGKPSVMTFRKDYAAEAGKHIRDALYGGADTFLYDDRVRININCIMAEMARAIAKFPSWPTDVLHAASIVGEESGELTKAALQAVYEPHKSSPGDVRAEAIQTAAMAIRFLMSIDRYDYGESHMHSSSDSAG